MTGRATGLTVRTSRGRRGNGSEGMIESLERRTLLSTGPAAPPVTWIPSPNFNSRGSTAIDAIVIHTTEESYAATVSEFQTPSSQVSAHYVVNSDGSITQMVDTANRAWHATYYNSRSVGIENVGFAGQASTWNDKNIPALEHLVAYLAYTYKVPVVHPTDNAYDYPNDTFNEPGIVAHAQVQPWNRTDPGPYFPWTKFIADVKQIIADAAQAPFHGTPFNIGASAVTIQAEDFDTGGEGVAYHDVEAANRGGKYRTGDGVDIESTSDAGGGYDVGYTRAGEWMEYTVNVATAGKYDLAFRVASAAAGAKFHGEIDGANVTGSLAVPNTGGSQKWTTVTKTGVSLSAGKHVLRLAFDTAASNGALGNFNWIKVSPPPAQTPFHGSPFNVPSSGLTTIQAEDFDNGGEGVAYHDLDSVNSGGAYRNTGVDIQATSDAGGGYNVGWTRAGEWLEYTIHVSVTGAYNFGFRVASAGSGATFHANIDGANVTGTLTVPNTGGAQKWQTVTKNNITLAAGDHVLRVKMDANGSNGAVGNFNYFQIGRATV